MPLTKSIREIVHPEYRKLTAEWKKFRAIFEGGQQFINRFLTRFSSRENETDFNYRKKMAYNPAHSKAAVMKVKNHIFQRLVDVTREGGSISYKAATVGDNGGVDMQGSTMNGFIGREVLPELLFMGKVGIYLDKPNLLPGSTLAESSTVSPYMYIYKAEDIRSWTFDRRGTLISVLLRDHAPAIDPETRLTINGEVRYRLMQLVDEGVLVQFFDKVGNAVETVLLDLPAIPLVIATLSHSLLTDIANHQIALLQASSSDIDYIMKANFPFMTEQYMPASELLHGRQAIPQSTQTDVAADGTVTNFSADASGGTAKQAGIAKPNTTLVGNAHGRRYPHGVDAPAFIHPSPEPLQAAMQKEGQITAEILQLLNLSVMSLQPVRASQESREHADRPLESGLSYVGMELEYNEAQLGALWSIYEGSNDVPTVQYPQSYQVISEAERRQMGDEIIAQMDKLPSIDYKRAMAKAAIKILVGHRVATEELQAMFTQIDTAEIIITDSETIIADVEAGLLSNDTGSKARGYPDGEAAKAEEDHAKRVARIAAAQSREAARGNPDADPDRGDVSKDTNTDRQDTTADRSRGDA